MDCYYLGADEFTTFVSGLLEKSRIVAPVAKDGKFAFETLTSAGDLRLDYDVTILPPKKVFWPPVQPLLKFGRDSVENCIKPEATILFGVHFYDIK